jgi:hypothetical protein
MPIVRFSLAAAILAASPVAAAQTANPLAGDTQAPSASAVTNSVGGLIIPEASRGKLEPDAASGGVAFADELGWYRFTMADGGTTQLEGTTRKFSFEAGTLPTTCFSVRVPDASFAAFSVAQIQAELETLYPTFDALVVASGFEIVHRESLKLDSSGQRSAVPITLMAWDSRDQAGNRVTWTLMPSPVGQLVFACGGHDPGHHREVMQRYLRIGEGMIAAKK